MTSFLSVKGVTHPASSSSSSSCQSSTSKLPRGLNFCDHSNKQTARGNYTSVASSTSSQWTNHLESAISLGRSKSRRGSDLVRRCQVATNSERVTADKSGSETELLPSEEEAQKPLRRLSHFLRELARQDVWAGLLDPFQAVGANSSQVNYLMQDLKRRSTSPEDLVSQIAQSSKIPVLQDQSNIGTEAVNFYEGGEDVFPPGTRMELAAMSPATDVISYAAETWNGSYTGMNHGLLTNPVHDSSSDSKVVEASTMSSGSSNHLLRAVPQAELCHKSATCVTAADLGSAENLSRWLQERIGSSIISTWGVAPGTKQVANLWCELVEGEISLEDSSPPKRSTHVISVKIKNDEGLVLVESHQEMADGRRRPRNRPLSEKMRPGEQVEEACLRGIFEELGCQLGASERVMIDRESYKREEEERESFSYPGLPTRYVIHTMDAHVQQLPSTEFSTEEDESGHASNPAGVEALNGSSAPEKKAVGVKRHFWRWVPENGLADFCRR